MFVATARPGHDEADVFWFGGGIDLTPYYPFEDDARHFHTVCRDALASHGPEYYPRYKRWCDEYFSLKHRRSEEHTSELQSLMRISYAVFCLKKKQNNKT